MNFDPAFFKRLNFSREQIFDYFDNALRDFEIAQQDKFIEVRFTYCYQALIKSGIALLAHKGSVKVRSVPGHHIKILEVMSNLLKNPDVEIIGNILRTKRNLDLYEGGTLISESELTSWLNFTEEVLLAVQKELPSRFDKSAP